MSIEEITPLAAVAKSKVKADKNAWMMLTKDEILALAEFADAFLIDVPIPKRGEPIPQPKNVSEL